MHSISVTPARRWLAVVLALVTGLALLAPTTAEAADDKDGAGDLYGLTVLHHNDGESQLIDAGADLTDFGGIARFVSLTYKLRREALRDGNGVVIVSSGDNFLAGPEWNASIEKGVPFYDALGMSAIPYDAATIGNHEFDFGPDVLADFINSFRKRVPTFLSANLDFSAEPNLQALVDSGRIAPSTVITERGRKIGIIGVTTDTLPFVTSPRNVVIDSDIAGVVQAEADAMTAAGVDIIILSGHLQGIDSDLELVSQLRNVDIIIAGGGDELLANDGDLLIPGDEEDIHAGYPVWGTDADGVAVPIVTGPGGYQYIGQLEAYFDADGVLVAVGDDSGTNRVSGVAPDRVAPSQIVTRKVVEPVVAYLEDLATTIIADSAVALDGVRGNVRSMETNQGNLMADSLLWQATELSTEFGSPVPDVALQNGGGIRNDSVIPAGDVTLLDTYDMAPFSNFVTVIPDISREQFKEILENAVSAVEFGSGRFAQVAGFSFTYSASGTAQELDDDENVVVAGTRVQEVVLDDGTVIVSGGAVVAGDAITIATIDFLARGGDQYPYRGAEIVLLGTSYQQALANYITDGLGGVIGAADYPEGGEGRITAVD